MKAGSADYYCEDVKGPTFTQGDVETMWKACQSLAPASGAAAGSASAPGASGDILEQGIALVEEVASIIVDNQNDCDKMAAALKKQFADNADTYKKVKAAEKALSPAKKNALDARTKGFEKKVEAPIKKCANNKALGDAMGHAPF